MAVGGSAPLGQPARRRPAMHRRQCLGLVQAPLTLRVSARLAANWTHWVREAESLALGPVGSRAMPDLLPVDFPAAERLRVYAVLGSTTMPTQRPHQSQHPKAQRWHPLPRLAQHWALLAAAPALPLFPRIPTC